eukprot:361780-Chlamydomonas_euryale.AAC.2
MTALRGGVAQAWRRTGVEAPGMPRRHCLCQRTFESTSPLPPASFSLVPGIANPAADRVCGDTHKGQGIHS